MTGPAVVDLVTLSARDAGQHRGHIGLVLLAVLVVVIVLVAVLHRWRKRRARERSGEDR